VEWQWEEEVSSPYGRCPVLLFQKAARDAVMGKQAVRLLLPEQGALRAATPGTQATLSCAVDTLFRIEEVRKTRADGEVEGQLCVVLTAADQGWHGLDEDEAEGTLTVLLAASNLEEAIFSSTHALALARDEEAHIFHSVDIIDHLQESFPSIADGMAEEDLGPALAYSPLFQVIDGDDGWPQVLRRTSSSPLEESVQRLLRLHRSHSKPWPWISTQLPKVLGPRDPDLDRRILETSVLVQFLHSKDESCELVKLTGALEEVEQSTDADKDVELEPHRHPDVRSARESRDAGRRSPDRGREEALPRPLPRRAESRHPIRLREGHGRPPPRPPRPSGRERRSYERLPRREDRGSGRSERSRGRRQDVRQSTRHDDRRRRSEQRRTDTSRRRGERTRSRHHGRPSADRDPRREDRRSDVRGRHAPAVPRHSSRTGPREVLSRRRGGEGRASGTNHARDVERRRSSGEQNGTRFLARSRSRRRERENGAKDKPTSLREVEAAIHPSPGTNGLSRNAGTSNDIAGIWKDPPTEETEKAYPVKAAPKPSVRPSMRPSLNL